jgi:hypothetical protein
MANWKVKAQSIIGRKSRSSFKIELSGRSEEDFDLNYKNCTTRDGLNQKELVIRVIIRKEDDEGSDRHFVHEDIRNVEWTT